MQLRRSHIRAFKWCLVSSSDECGADAPNGRSPRDLSENCAPQSRRIAFRTMGRSKPIPDADLRLRSANCLATETWPVPRFRDSNFVAVPDGGREIGVILIWTSLRPQGRRGIAKARGGN